MVNNTMGDAAGKVQEVENGKQQGTDNLVYSKNKCEKK